jgi:hypothetical protein
MSIQLLMLSYENLDFIRRDVVRLYLTRLWFPLVERAREGDALRERARGDALRQRARGDALRRCAKGDALRGHARLRIEATREWGRVEGAREGRRVEATREGGRVKGAPILSYVPLSVRYKPVSVASMTRLGCERERRSRKHDATLPMVLMVEHQ